MTLRHADDIAASHDFAMLYAMPAADAAIMPHADATRY